ncbi:MAG: DUF58 domain-containing protein [Proteobacteria bacterium]|jgi:uncharacterized protein (DUF58 family)|nr:DUF58 domain-containing protein [Pseudomonadota bacterium]
MNPSLGLVLALAVASLGAVASAVASVPYAVSLAPTAMVLVFAIADRVLGTATRVEIARRVRAVLSVGIGNPVQLSIRNTGARALRLELADEPPPEGTSSPEGVLRALVSPRSTVKVEYLFTPARRGRFCFDAVRVRHLSALGMWRVARRFELKDEIQVYPNIEALRRFGLLARRNALAELGVRATRMRGDGTEFERMREYRPGDEPRRVDWKTTARLGKLYVREMGQERNQNVLFMIDVGRMMQQTTEGLSHFDYALNTAIILGHIAQQRGDNVGALLFSDTVKKFIPLERGRRGVDALVRAAYDVEPEPLATNYRRAFKYVMAHVRRRALLLLMTHLVPGEDQRLIRGYAAHLGRRHLPLCLFFREPSLAVEAEKVPATAAEAFHVAAAADILLDRQESLSILRHAGVMALDAQPGEYSAVAINQYLDIKARNLL